MPRTITLYFEKVKRPARKDRRRFRTEKKSKSVLGCEPGLLGNNAIAPPLAPPPRPMSTVSSFSCLSPQTGFRISAADAASDLRRVSRHRQVQPGRRGRASHLLLRLRKLGPPVLQGLQVQQTFLTPATFLNLIMEPEDAI